MAIALNLSSRLSGRNNRAICPTVKAEYKFAICLLLGVWLGYQLRRSYFEWWYIGGGISESQVNNKQLPNSVVQNGSAGSSYSNVRTGSEGIFAELRNHEIGKDFLKDYQDSNNKIDELKALLDKTEKEHQRRKKNLEALLHGKDYEKGAQPGNFQTGPDPSELNDGDHSFSIENGPLQHVHHKHGFSESDGILQLVHDRHSFLDEHGTRQHVRVNKIDEKGALTNMKGNIQPDRAKEKVNKKKDTKPDKMDNKAEEYYQRTKKRSEDLEETFLQKLSDGAYDTLLHGKDGEKGLQTKANSKTKPDESEMNDGIFRINKIEEKGALIKIKANIRTEPDQSKLKDGVYSFSDENGIPQHVLGNYFGMKSTEAETETEPDQSNSDDKDRSFSDDENGPTQHVHVKYGFHDEHGEL